MACDRWKCTAGASDATLASHSIQNAIFQRIRVLAGAYNLGHMQTTAATNAAPINTMESAMCQGATKYGRLGVNMPTTTLAVNTPAKASADMRDRNWWPEVVGMGATLHFA